MIRRPRRWRARAYLPLPDPVCATCTAAYELTGDDERAFVPAVAELVVGALRVALCDVCAWEATR